MGLVLEFRQFYSIRGLVRFDFFSFLRYSLEWGGLTGKPVKNALHGSGVGPLFEEIFFLVVNRKGYIIFCLHIEKCDV